MPNLLLVATTLLPLYNKILPVTPTTKLLVAAFFLSVLRPLFSFWLIEIICSLLDSVPVTVGNPPATP